MATFKNDPEALAALVDGHAGKPAAGMWSSPRWCAWRVGVEIARLGLPAPIAARMSRGYSVAVMSSTQYRSTFTLAGRDLDNVAHKAG